MRDGTRAVVLRVLAAFGAGALFGLSRDSDLPAPIEIPRHSTLIASLRQENLSLRTQSISSTPTSPPATRRTTHSAATGRTGKIPR